MNKQLTTAMMAASMMGMMGDRNDMVPREDISRAPIRDHHSWDGVQLSKAERKGKTPDELQALRRARWEADHA